MQKHSADKAHVHVHLTDKNTALIGEDKKIYTFNVYFDSNVMYKNTMYESREDIMQKNSLNYKNLYTKSNNLTVEKEVLRRWMRKHFSVEYLQQPGSAKKVDASKTQCGTS